MNSLYKILALLFLIIPAFLFAQNDILNPGFEDWTNGNPQGWATTNLQGQLTNVTQSAEAHGGASAARGEVVEFNGFPFPVSISTGSVPFPVTQNHARLTGFYQLEAASQTEILGVTISLLDAGFGQVAGKIDTLTSTNGSYQLFTIELDYNGGAGNAAFASIQFAIGSTGALALGTFFLIDDLQFEGVVTSVEQQAGQTPNGFTLQQNYPNPFNPSTTFVFTIPNAANVNLTVFDVLGRRVAQVLKDRLPAGSHKVQWQAGTLPSGAYYYQISADGFRAARKLLLLK